MFSAFVCFLLFAHALAQDANCDFSQNVSPGVTYRISSPADLSNGNYRPGRRCRWLAFCPTGYQCRLDCTLELPQSTGCSVDQVRISRTGDSGLTNADTYCGRLTLPTILSVGTSIAVGLFSSTSGPGGRFSCNLSAQQAQQPAACQCGQIRSNRIVGGTAAAQHEFNMMAGLVDAGNRLIFCGGTITSNRYILTAAHCVQGRSPASIIVSVGDSSLNAGIKFGVNSITIHPQFNANNYDYDIALLYLNATMTFTDFVGPVCLPFYFGNADPTGVTVTLLGWGTQFFGGPNSQNLLKTNVTFISQNECRSYQPGVTNQQICTRTPGKDACQNDSGGPVLYFDPTTYRAFILGAVSYGNGCGSTSPGVHTRIQNFTTWIVNNAPASYCVVQ